jgi:hypothetical protein
MSGFDLKRQIDLLLTNWNVGVEALHTGWGGNYKVPTVAQILEVIPDVLESIRDHQRDYNITMSNYDCNKVTNYVAWFLDKKFPGEFEMFPLFFGHLHFIDESIRSASLFHIPNLPLIAVNLEKFHKNGHMLAPYGFIKGVDLTFTFCCGDGVKKG